MYSLSAKHIFNILPSLCKGRNHLESCWNPVVQSCSNKMANFMDDIIAGHIVVCDIGVHRFQVVTVPWSQLFCKNNTSQEAMQTNVLLMKGYFCSIGWTVDQSRLSIQAAVTRRCVCAIYHLHVSSCAQ